MSRTRQSMISLAIVVFATCAHGQTIQPSSRPVSLSATNTIPSLPVVQSPVTLFRRLLMMSSTERTQTLARRTPESRARILAKIREYQALDPNERELRLRVTELRWYLVPLMRTAPANRDPQLTMVPPELRDLAKSRLAQWDQLSPSMQQEFLANENTLHYLTQPPMPGTVTNVQADSIAEQFNNIFNLTPVEQQQLLGTLSEAERAQMEKTLGTFKQLPPQQRAQCIRNYAKFAGMSAPERAEFLKNAATWSKMSPEERKTWRDLVAQVPMWPPLPPLIPPHVPMPPHIVPKSTGTNMAITN